MDKIVFFEKNLTEELTVAQCLRCRPEGDTRQTFNPTLMKVEE